MSPKAIDIMTLVTTPQGAAVWQALLPFIPALLREGPEVYAGFLEHFGKADWVAIDQLMYEKMTFEERRVLESQVYLDAVDAVQAHVDQIALIQSVALQVLVKLAMFMLVP